MALTAFVLAAGLLIPSGSENAPLDIKRHAVEVEIDNGIARTAVEQVFANNQPRPLEATYRFPVPEDATISHFSMWINGKEVTGEVLERTRARTVYESITQARQDPGLLEQQDDRVFQVRVFPVPANGEQRIRIEYLQPVEVDMGVATYTYPLATKSATGSMTTGELSMTVDLRSEVPLERVESPSHRERFAAVRRAPGQYRFSFEEQRVTLDEDFVLSYQLERDTTGLDLVADAPAKDDGFFLLTLTPGKELDAELAPMDLVFLLDVSGSMGDEGKLPAAHRAIDTFLSGLRPADRFNVVFFNIAAEGVFEKCEPATPEARAVAMRQMSMRRPMGGTDLLPALKHALELRERSDKDRDFAVILLSDGRATDGDASHERYLQLGRRAKGVRVYSFGLGNDVNRPLLDGLARATGGHSEIISTADDVERRTENLRRKVLHPVATDLELTFDGVEVTELHPAKMPDLFWGTQARIYGRYKGGGPATIRAKGKVLGETRTLEAGISLPARGKGERRPELQRMWAREAIEDLVEQTREKGETEAQRRRGTEIGVKYGVVSPWTSFLVLESEQQFSQFGIERTNLARREEEQQVAQARAAANAIPATAPAPQAIAPAPKGTPWRPNRGGGGGGWPRGGGGGGSATPLLVGMLAAAFFVRRAAR